ncbi:MAG: type VI secretion protein IcmF/TssM N-terminal domain-containing protein [Opitutaceae bacterium]
MDKTKLKKPLAIAAGVIALLGIPVVAGLLIGKGEGSWVIMLVTFGALVLFLGLFLLFLKLWKAKKGSALGKLLRKDAKSTSLEGVESIRSNFEAGIEKLRNANKNVYDLPWFLMAGQAGAGKTEAIRRSHTKEDFPAGLNDLMQGVGGTLNMNWWFTNKGIILDTAGRIFEEKVVAGQTTEWSEFLKMLKQGRKNMPINGFILAIPADSLIRDTFAEIEEKASHIAEQITVVQNTLGVRFPVFIIVTKTDFIPGFREFVENVKEPRLQQQMLGWSNPKGLDEPFAPEQVDSYLNGVIEKLKKRRLTYMLDPRPDGDRRLSDLDALFTFPEALRDAVPNLRRYIEIVFSLNPWAQKPLFIRGIYFTSSLQQGDALDKAIADVMGKNLQEMTLSTFKKETPLFLRDTFFEKIYREYGLVTSAKQVKGAIRKRNMIFGIVSVLAVLSILAAAWFGSRSFRQQVGNEYGHWKFAADQFQPSATGATEWTRPIVYDTGIGANFASEKDIEFSAAGEDYTLPTYLSSLAGYSRSELKVPGVFKPLKFFDDVVTGDRLDRDRAFRQVFEGSVIKPILLNSRDKLREVTVDSWDQRSVDGLRAQVKMQMLLNQTDRGPEFSEQFYNELDALYFYLTEDKLGDEITEVYRDFYGSGYIADSGWPSSEFDPLYARAESIDDPALAGMASGLSLWLKEMDTIKGRQEKDLEQLTERLGHLEQLGQQEKTFLSGVLTSNRLEVSQVNQMKTDYSVYKASLQSFSANDTAFFFAEYYSKQINGSKRQVEDRVSQFADEMSTVGSDSDPLASSVLAKVKQKERSVLTSFDRLVSDDLVRRFESADAVYLAEDDGLSERLALYDGLQSDLAALDRTKLLNWIEGPKTLDKAEAQKAEALVRFDNYGGAYQKEMNELRSFVESRHGAIEKQITADYKGLLVSEVRSKVGFPVVVDAEKSVTPEGILEFGKRLATMSVHIASVQEKLDPVLSQDLETLVADLKRISQFIETHLTADALSAPAQFSVLSIGDTLRAVKAGGGSGELRASIFWRARLVQLGNQNVPLRMSNQSIGLGAVSLSSSSVEIVFSSTVGGSIGDVGRYNQTGSWSPLRLLLARDARPNPSIPGSYTFVRSVSLADGSRRPFAYSMQVSPALPTAQQWLKLSDLSNF